MLEQIAAWNTWLNGYVWGWPTIVLLLGTGVLLTAVTGAVQFRYLGRSLREVLGKITQKRAGAGSVSPFQAVATALASTVGVGNIAGVATAISIGGPGALFWLWVSGLLGMGTKFAEIVIAMHYREPDAGGSMRGGAMYTLRGARLAVARRNLRGPGLPRRLRHRQHGPGQFGCRQPARELRHRSVPDGIVLAVDHRAAVILGGIKRIGELTEILVPPWRCSISPAASSCSSLRHRVPGRSRSSSMARSRHRSYRRIRRLHDDDGHALRSGARAVLERGRTWQRADGARGRPDRPSGPTGHVRHLRGVRRHDPHLYDRAGHTRDRRLDSGATGAALAGPPSRPGCPGRGATSSSRPGSCCSRSRR